MYSYIGIQYLNIETQIYTASGAMKVVTLKLINVNYCLFQKVKKKFFL